MTTSRKRILVIEDDPSVRSLLQRAFFDRYEVEAVSDGTEAEMRLHCVPIPDLMICDVMLPGMDGFALARLAKTSEWSGWSNVPIIFLTARTTPRDMIEGIQSGARHYVTKPFKLKDLQDKVKKILGE